MHQPHKEVALAFSPDFAQDLLALALEQSQWEAHILQQMKAAVERNDVQDVFRLAQQLTGAEQRGRHRSPLASVWSFSGRPSSET